MSDVNIRELVLDSLIEIVENKKYAGQLESDVLVKYSYLEKRDRAFYTRLVEGTLGSLMTIDYYINQFSKTPVRKQKPLIRNLLRMTVYQILYMDSVPESAAINEAVKLAKKRGFSQLSGFVNGVLRNLARNKASLKLPDEEQTAEYLSVRYSIPQWIVDRFIREYGKKQTEDMLAGFEEPQVLSVRVNTDKITRDELILKLKAEGADAYPVKELADAVYLDHIDRLEDLSSFHTGEFYVQDVSSMMVAEWADVKENSYCVDVCAAPGGKTTDVALLMHGTGQVDARDLTDRKVALIYYNIERMGLKNVTAKVWDATIPDPDAMDKADLVICDAPCSGLGVMGKKKDIRYNATSEGIDALAEIQRQILHTCAGYVKAGGVLMYSTCTICKAENEQNVEWFLAEHPEFQCTKMRQIFPHEVGNDGFFLAKLEKQKES